MSIITPTVGRSILFKPDPVNNPTLLFVALICAVHSDRLVNLAVFDEAGNQFSRQSVTLVQDGDEAPAMPHAVCMPFQLGQARVQLAALPAVEAAPDTQISLLSAAEPSVVVDTTAASTSTSTGGDATTPSDDSDSKE